VATDSKAVDKRAGGSVGETGAQSSVTKVRPRPEGLLPHSQALRDASSEDKNRVLNVAEGFFPEKSHISELSHQTRGWWIPYATVLLEGEKATKGVIQGLVEMYKPTVDAQVKDLEERQAFDFAIKQTEIEKEDLARSKTEKHEDQRIAREDKKLAEDLADQQQEREIARERWEHEKAKDNILLANRSRRENVVLGMAVISFFLVVAACVVGLASENHVLAGSSGGTALAMLGVVLGRSWLDHKQSAAIAKQLAGETTAPPPDN
jgi:hypothetical protein